MMSGVRVDGRYEVVSVLGGGAFGQTFLAKDTRRPGHPFCVIKQLRYVNSNPAALEHARRLFKKEAEILEKLGYHDQIPTLLADIEEQQEFYLVQQFVPGQSLIQEILPGIVWEEQQVIKLLQEVLQILVFVHGQGVIHRDIKPANLMRRQPDDRIVLIDFGAVKELGTQIALGDNMLGASVPTIAIGTPGYMAIEQFNGQPQFNSDLYALGIIAIQALLGLSADQLSGLKDISTHPPGEIKWRHRRPVSLGLAEVLDKMVLSDYRQRYQTAAAALADLAKLELESTYLPESLASPPPPTQSTIIPPPEPTKATTIAPPPSPSPSPLPIHPSTHPLIHPSTHPSHQGKRLIIAAVTTLLTLAGLAGIGYSQRGQVAEYFYNQGKEKSRFGDVKAALDDYNLAIQIDPSYADAYARRCGSYLRLEDDDRARADCQQAVDLDSDNSIATLNWGNYYTEQRDLNQANQYYTKAVELSSREIQLQPSNADAYYHRGAARLRLGDYPGAIEDATQAIKLDPQYVEAYIARCQAQGQLSNHDAAASDCKQATEINPNHYVAYASLCNNLSNAGQYAAAIASCTHALQINPNDSYGYNNRGVVYLKMGNYPLAVNDYKQAIQRDAKDAVAYHNLGDVLSLQGDQPGAIEAYTQAIANNPDFAAAYYGRGLRQAALGNTDAAVADFQRSAEIYTQQGKSDRAEDALYQIRVVQGTLTPEEVQAAEQPAAPSVPESADSTADPPATVTPVVEPAAPLPQAPVGSYVEEPAAPAPAPLPVSPDPFVQNPPAPYSAPASPHTEEPPIYLEPPPSAQPDSIAPAPHVEEPAPIAPIPAPADSLQTQPPFDQVPQE